MHTVNAHVVAVPIFMPVSLIANAKLEVARVGRKGKLEGKCVIDDVSSTGTDDLRISASGVDVRLPAVPCGSDENFLVETQVFHFDCSHDRRFRLLDDHIFQ